MKRLIIVLTICLVLSIPKLAICEIWTGNINAHLGFKELDKDDWEPVESHTEFGVLSDFRQETWPISIAIDILYSKDDATEYDSDLGTNIDAEGNTLELNLGIRKIWEKPSIPVRPFFGGGIAFIKAEGEISAFGSTFSDDDKDVGIWLNGGFYLTINNSFNIGLDLRWSKANVKIFDITGDAGGFHYGLIAGYHW